MLIFLVTPHKKLEGSYINSLITTGEKVIEREGERDGEIEKKQIERLRELYKKIEKLRDRKWLSLTA